MSKSIDGKVHILLIGGYSSTNIGNMFYEMGAQNMFLQALDNCVIHRTSDLSLYFWNRYRKEKNGFEPIEHICDVDYVVWMGPVFDAVSMKKWQRVLDVAQKNNIGIICVGAGSNQYDEEEIRAVKSIIKGYPFKILISRDSWTYNAFGECFNYAYDGICTAFFSALCFNPWKMDINPFIVYDFETYTEPKFAPSTDGFMFNSGYWKMKTPIRRLTPMTSLLGNLSTVEFGDVNIVRTKNTCIKPSFLQGGKHKGQNVYLSDVAEDYLNIYYNGIGVFSDRVHACVATLSMGKPAMFFGNTPRARLFDRVLGDKADRIYVEPIQLDMEMLNSERKNQVEFLKSVL